MAKIIKAVVIRRWSRRLICAAVLAVAAAATAAAELPPHNPTPGGVAVIRLEQTAAPIRVLFGVRRVAVVAKRADWYAVVGIGAGVVPGRYALKITTAADREARQQFVVLPAAARQPILQLPDALAEISLASPLPKNRRKLNTELWQNTAAAEFNFMHPVAYEKLIPFGLVANKKLAAAPLHNAALVYLTAADAAVVAPAAGVVHRVVRSRTAGFAVYLNHGQGIASVLTHLAHAAVQVGDAVARGDHLGTAQAILAQPRARADWYLLMNGEAVNPQLLLAQ